MTEEELDSIFNALMGNGHGVDIIFPESYEPIGDHGYGNVIDEYMDEPFLLTFSENCGILEGAVVNSTISLEDFLEDAKKEIEKKIKEVARREKNRLASIKVKTKCSQ